MTSLILNADCLYLTMSQLGICFGLGSLAYSAAMFHLVTRMLFKALLFPWCGVCYSRDVQ